MSISEKRRIAKFWKKGKICIKRLTKAGVNWRKSQISSLSTISMVIETKVVIGLFNLFNLTYLTYFI